MEIIRRSENEAGAVRIENINFVIINKRRFTMATYVGIGATDPNDDLIFGNHKVGIGTTTPYHPVDVQGSSYPVVRILSTGVEGGDLMLSSSQKTWEMLVEGSDLQIWEGQQNVRMAFQNGGNVGIGAINPAAQTHIKGNLNVALPAQATSSGRNITSNGHGLAAGDSVKLPSGPSGAFEIFTVASVASANVFKVDSDLSNPITNQTGYCDPTLFKIDSGDGVNKVSVPKSGNVGIGTTDPKGLLQLGNPVTGYSSIVVAPAPTGDKTTDYNNIVNAVKAVYNYISGSDPEEQDKSGTVYLQAGKYCIGETLKFLDDGTDGIYAWGLKLIGAGMESTIIEMDYTGQEDDMPIIQVSARGVAIKDLSIETVATQPNKHIGIKFCGSDQDTASTRNCVENVRIDYLNTGILLTNAYGNTFRQVNIFRCHTGVQVGVSGGYDNSSNDNQFFGGGTGLCDHYGVRFVNGCSNVLSGFGAENCGAAGDEYAGVCFECDGNRYIGNSMVGCYLESVGGPYHPSLVKLGSKCNSINNCYFLRDNTSKKFLDITFSPSAFGNVLLGNTFHSTPGGDVFTDEATLFLGDQYQQIRGECDNGLVFQTFWEYTDKNDFRWKGKEEGGTLHDVMTLKAYSGMLGINETAPTHKLTVSGTAQNDIVWGERIRNTDTAYVSPYSSGAGILFSINEYPGVSKVAGIAGVSENQWGNSFGLRFFSGNDVSAPKMTINGGGAVGINTTQPVSKLHVEIGSAGTAAIGQVASNYAMFVPAVQGQDKFQGVIGIGESGNQITAAIGTYDDNAGGAQGLWLATGNNSGLYDRVHIDSMGNVGIGKLPGDKLDVNGKIICNDGIILQKSSDPTSVLVDGLLYYNTTSRKLRIYDSIQSTWRDVFTMP
jgi:hypothetical protein